MAENIIRQEMLGNVKMTFEVGVRKVGENDKKVGFLYLKWYTTVRVGIYLENDREVRIHL